MTIRSELESKLITFGSAQYPTIPVAVQNVSFTKPAGKPFLEIIFLASVTINPAVDAAGERETGLMQINVCIPEGVGTKAANDLIASIKALYPVLPKTGTVSIDQPPQIGTGFSRTDGYWVIPMTFKYRQER